MHKLNIKPLSVNEAWQGRRFKTAKYNLYQSEMLLILPQIKLPLPPYSLYFVVGYSNKQSDIDNFLKPTIDCMQKKYGFNDREIYQLFIEKRIVKKGEEFISFKIEHL